MAQELYTRTNQKLFFAGLALVRSIGAHHAVNHRQPGYGGRYSKW